MILQAPHCCHMRSAVKFGDVTLTDTMLKDGLIDAFHQYHMGITGKDESIVAAKQYITVEVEKVES